MDLSFFTVGLIGGLLLALMDALIHSNPLAVRMYEAYRPIARTRIPAPVAMLIDIAFGFLMAGIFVVLYASLPGESVLLKGLSFGLLVWLFRVLMQVTSQWVMFNVPWRSLLYTAAAGLGQMLAMGIFYSMMLT